MPPFDFAAALLAEFDREMGVTRAVLDRVPDDRLDFTPHPKSMTLARLAGHLATLPGWLLKTLTADGIDFAATEPPPKLTTRADMLAEFDRAVTDARRALAALSPDQWAAPWTTRNGPDVLNTATRWHVYRIWCLNHLVHHRGQLNLYLRLLNVPVPTIYFNSADDPTWRFD